MEVASPAPALPPDHHRPWRTAGRMLSGAAALLPLVVASLFLGMAIYHYVEHLSWSDAFLNSAMLLGGMGPVDPLKTTLGKWLAGLYAMFAGLIVIVVAGVMLAPMFQHVLMRHHQEMHETTGPSKKTGPTRD